MTVRIRVSELIFRVHSLQCCSNLLVAMGSGQTNGSVEPREVSRTQVRPESRPSEMGKTFSSTCVSWCKGFLLFFVANASAFVSGPSRYEVREQLFDEMSPCHHAMLPLRFAYKTSQWKWESRERQISSRPLETADCLHSHHFPATD